MMNDSNNQIHLDSGPSWLCTHVDPKWQPPERRVSNIMLSLVHTIIEQKKLIVYALN